MTTVSDDFSDTVDAVIRSLVQPREFEQYKRTGRYNLGHGTLNRMIADLIQEGSLSAVQHMQLKRRLASCELNVHLDDLPNAKRHGPFVVITNDL